ncbi:hypothetical protein GQ457_01G010810 [Hibiscus cannabinus]
MGLRMPNLGQNSHGFGGTINPRSPLDGGKPNICRSRCYQLPIYHQESRRTTPIAGERDGQNGCLREKMVEVASSSFIVVSDDSKLVSGLGVNGLAILVEVMTK